MSGEGKGGSPTPPPATGMPSGRDGAAAPWVLVCSSCGEPCRATAATWRCDCGGALDVEAPPLGAGLDDPSGGVGIWRFRAAYPVVSDHNVVSLGEGATPLISARSRAGFFYKVDSLCPTGSFKDRGTAVLTGCLRQLGVELAVEDSSGNAGASMAAYFAAAGIEGTIFVPASTSPAKTTQIRAHGARLTPVRGTRAEVAAAAQAEAEANEAYYASHLWSPFFLAGMMSVAFELWEQLGRRAPDRLIVPVGGGTLLLGAWLGFRHLLASGAVERVPAIVGVQSEAFAPLLRAYEQGAESVDDVVVAERPSLAEGIRIRNPPRSRQILRAVRQSGGRIEVVDDAEIRRGWSALARQGLYAEPTGAVAAAAALRLADRREQEDGEVTVAVVTGSGLKGVAGVLEGGHPRNSHGEE